MNEKSESKLPMKKLEKQSLKSIFKEKAECFFCPRGAKPL
jgi:hypothetical protein